MADSKQVSFLDMLPESDRPVPVQASEGSGAYTAVPLGDGIAQQVLQHLAASGKKPGLYTSNPRGKNNTTRTTKGYRIDTDIRMPNGSVVEFRGVVKWPVKG